MRKLLLIIAGLIMTTPAYAQNFTATPGSGYTFGAKSVSGILYPQQTMCDPATPAQCMSVNASGQPTIANTGFNLLQGGAANSASNPFFFTPGTGASFPITGNVGLNAGTNAIGSITNTAFGISGTLPSFNSTQTFNCGTGCYQATQPVSGTFWPYTLGQQLAASSVPVVLTAAQLTALTPPSNTGYSTAANQSTEITALNSIVTNTGGPIPAGGAVIGQVVQAGGNVSYTVTPTVAASAHAAGSSVGGLQTVSFFRASPSSPAPASPFSGILNNVKWTWKTGSNTTAVTVYIFSANPSNSTCTDATAFSLNAADVAKQVAGSPFTLTPAVIGSGATISTAYSQSPISVKNSDSTPGQSLYTCVIANAAVTPAANDGVLTESGIVD